MESVRLCPTIKNFYLSIKTFLFAKTVKSFQFSNSRAERTENGDEMSQKNVYNETNLI
jgi:hypothetical protein